MTAATLSRLPISAGGAAAASLARGVYWVLNRLIDLGYLVAAQFMRAPVAISTIAAIVAFSLLAGGNALYFQSSRHPAPLFFAPPRHATPAPAAKPVIPAMRPRPVIDEETTGSLGTAPAADTIDNTDVLLLQRKLAALKFFDGTPDGIFGRRTASAIKTFEIKADLKPRGKLTRELLATVLAAPVPTAAEAPSTSTTVADVAAIAATKPAAARPASTTVTAGGAPVPLAPLPRTVSVIRVANTAPVVPVDTFSANSLPATDATPAASASAPAAAAPEPSVPAPQPLASAAPPATDPANDGSVVAMNNLPPEKATLPAAPAAAPIATQQVATAQASPAGVAPESAAPGAAAPDSTVPLTPGQKLAAQMGTLPPGATPAGAAPNTVVANVDSSSDPGDDAGSTDPALITKIQRALASLGFLAQKIDGVPGEGTAKAIRNFEVFYDYKVTGLATPQLLNLLVQHGAQV